MPIQYRLKPGQESFEIISGPDAGKSFARGKIYTDIPKGYADRFEKIPPHPSFRQSVSRDPSPKADPAPGGIPPSQVNGYPDKKKAADNVPEKPNTDAAENKKKA